jgi:hypothetical protein
MIAFYLGMLISENGGKLKIFWISMKGHLVRKLTLRRPLFSSIETQGRRIGFLFCKKWGLILLISMRHIWGYRLLLVVPEFILSTILRARFGAE